MQSGIFSKYIQRDLLIGLEKIFISYGKVIWRVHSVLYMQILLIQTMLKVYLHLLIYRCGHEDTCLHISAAIVAGRTGEISFMSNFQATGSTDMRRLYDGDTF